MYKRVTIIIMMCFLLAGIVPTTFAAELPKSASQPEGLTINQAVSMALKNSNTLNISNIDIDSKEELRDSASQVAPTYTPAGHSTPVPVFSAFVNLVNANIELQSAEKNKSKQEDSLAISVFSNYMNVIKASENLNYAQESMKYVQSLWNVAQLNYQVGTISKVQKDATENQFKTAQNSVKSAQIAADMAYQALNKSIGLNPDERPVLVDRPAYSVLEINNLEYEAEKAVENDPDIWNAEQQAYIAKLSVDLYDFSSLSTPYSVTENNADKANISVSNAKDQLKQGVRDIYNQILVKEQEYINQQEAVKQAEDNLQTKQLLFDVGMATSTDVQNCKLDLISKQKELNAAIYTHEYLKLVFAKPWAASGGTVSQEASGGTVSQ